MPYKNSEDFKNWQRKTGKKDRHKRSEERKKDRHLNKERTPENALSLNRYTFVDGESVNDRYVLLASSRHGYIYDENGLSTERCLEFLLKCAERSASGKMQCKPVGFGLMYDFNMILKDLNKKTCKRLVANGSVLWKCYRIELWTGKRLKITKYGTKDGWKTDLSNKIDAVTIDDVRSIFGGSFLKALDDFKIPVTPEDLEKMKKGKSERASFSFQNINEIIEYNNLECKYGQMLVEKLHEYLEQAGFHTTDSYSPAVYGKMLFRQNGIKDVLDRDLDWNSKDKMKRRISRAAYTAFLGGRIEIGSYGTFYGTVYNYDIRSSYPANMLQLPNLQRGSWSYDSNLSTPTFKPYSNLKDKKNPLKLFRRDIPFSLYHIRFNFVEDRRFYPFPFRQGNGAICFPSKGTIWVWYPELRAAIDHGDFKDGEIQILEAYYFVEHDPTDRPFSFIRDTYNLREKWKKEKNNAQYALKLAMNSSYGTLSMQEGAVKGHRPTWHQIEFAGYITSLTRAKIYETIRLDEDAIITIATDGIYTKRPLPIDLSQTGLGSWEYTEYYGIQLIMSGVYRLLKPKMEVTLIHVIEEEFERTLGIASEEFPTIQNEFNGQYIPNGNYEYMGRGFGNKLVDWGSVKNAWENGQTEVELETNPQFVGMRWAAIGDRWNLRNRWMKKKKRLRLTANGKRYDSKLINWNKTNNPAVRLVDTTPEIIYGSEYIESAEYKPRYLKRVSGELDEESYAKSEVEDNLLLQFSD